MSKNPTIKPSKPSRNDPDVKRALDASDASQNAHQNYRDTTAVNAHTLNPNLHTQAGNAKRNNDAASAAQKALDRQAATNKVLIDRNNATRANKGK